MNTALPVVVIGAGPVGLAAAAHLLGRGLTPLVLEAGPSVGAGMLRWAHVRMFSPWEFTLDRRARVLLERHGWQAPDLAAFPTGGEVVERYLRPLASVPELAPHVRVGARVQAVTRQRHDRMKDAGRNDVPFVVRFEDAAGEHELLAQAVIDASGTIETPNPMGASGIPALGERAAADRVFYGMPNVLGPDRERYGPASACWSSAAAIPHSTCCRTSRGWRRRHRVHAFNGRCVGTRSLVCWAAATTTS